MLVETRTIGSEIKRLRESRGLTAYRLAALSGVPRSNLSEFETGKLIPTDAALDKLAPHLGVSAVELKARAALDRMDPEVRRYILENEALRKPGPVLEVLEGKRPTGDVEARELPEQYRNLPHYGDIPAGEPGEVKPPIKWVEGD